MPTVASVRRTAKFAAEATFERPQLTDLVVAFRQRALDKMTAAAQAKTAAQENSDERKAAERAEAEFREAIAIADKVKSLSGKERREAIGKFSAIMFDGLKGKERWEAKQETYSFDELRALNAAARAEGLMGAQLPAKRHYKEARVIGANGAAPARRMQFLKEQAEAGVKLDKVVLMGAMTPLKKVPLGAQEGDAYWLLDFAKDNLDAAAIARAEDIHKNYQLTTQLDLIRASAYVVLNEKFPKPEAIQGDKEQWDQGYAGQTSKIPSSIFGGTDIVLVGANPRQLAKRGNASDAYEALKHVDYDRAEPSDPLLIVGTGQFQFQAKEALREAIKTGASVDFAGYGLVSQRLRDRTPPGARVLWEEREDAEDFVLELATAEGTGDEKRKNELLRIPGAYLQELHSLVSSSLALEQDIERTPEPEMTVSR